MTAIAWRGGFMAADTAIWGGGHSSIIVGHREKIVRLANCRGWFGAASASSDIRRVIAMLDGAQADDFTDLKWTGPRAIDEHFCGIGVRDDGTAWGIDAALYPVEIMAPFFCIGANEGFMLGALYAGASAEQAVRLAIAHTDGAAGDVQVVAVGPQ